MDDINPKIEETKENILSILSRNASLVAAVLILVIIISVLGVVLYYKNWLHAENQRMSAEVLQKEKDINSQILEEIYNFDQQIKALNSFLANHVYFSQIFPFLEKRTHEKIMFSSFSANSATGDVSLSARAQTLTVLAEQLAFLLRDPKIKSVNLSGMSVSPEGGIGFSLGIVVDKSVFLK